MSDQLCTLELHDEGQAGCEESSLVPTENAVSVGPSALRLPSNDNGACAIDTGELIRAVRRLLTAHGELVSKGFDRVALLQRFGPYARFGTCQR